MTPLSSGPRVTLHYLNIGRVPATVVLCLLGAAGWPLRYPHPAWRDHALAAPLSNLLRWSVSIVLSVFAVRTAWKILAPQLPG